MNILILVNPAKNYKYFFYNLGMSLKNSGHNIFYAFDSQKSKILSPIESMDKSPNSFFFDQFFQKNISINKHDFMFNCTWGEYYYSDFDRFLTQNYNLSHDSQYWLAVRQCLDRFFHTIITNCKINLVLYENVSNSFEYSAYRISRLLNKKYFGLIASRIPGRYEIQSSIITDQLKELEQAKHTPPTDEEMKWYNDYQSNINTIEPDYMKQNGLDNVSLLNKFNRPILTKIIRSVQADCKYGHYYDYASSSLVLRAVSSIKASLSRRINAQGTKKYFLSCHDVEQQKQEDKFFVYPMHYHPESSTSVLAPEYTNEFHNILNISNNLPFGHYLYVKDHKSAIGLQNKEFYRRVSALPAVKLVPDHYNIKNLIRCSLGVITVNSTAGYEALILGKPVYLLGNVFYENFNNVFKLKNFHSIKSFIQYKETVTDNLKNIIAYRRITYEGLLNFNLIDFSENKIFFDQLASNIQRKYTSFYSK